MKIAMYGSGAAGSVFASYLRNGGADIILIDRYEAHMKKVAEDGMHFIIHQEEIIKVTTDLLCRIHRSVDIKLCPSRKCRKNLRPVRRK